MFLKTKRNQITNAAAIAHKALKPRQNNENQMETLFEQNEVTFQLR